MSNHIRPKNMSSLMHGEENGQWKIPPVAYPLWIWTVAFCLLDGFCAHFGLSSSGACSLLSQAPGEGERQLFACSFTPSQEGTIPSIPLPLPGRQAQARTRGFTRKLIFTKLI